MADDLQFLTVEGFGGPVQIAAPGGWEFDATATIVWSRLRRLIERGFDKFGTKREKLVWEGQIYILCVVLARTCGMAPPYWERVAFELVTAERRR